MNLHQKRIHPVRRLIRKLVYSLLIISISGINAIAHPSIKISPSSMTIKELLLAIEHQSDFRFVYSDRLGLVNDEVVLNSTSMQVDEILKYLSDHSGVQYHILDDHLVVISAASIRQGPVISGVVRDANGDPVPGVNVIIKGTTTGVVTDIDGKYSISALSGNTLQFSFIGYVTEEVIIGEALTVDITLREDAQELEEIVVVGYGTVRKKDLTGSVSSVNNAKLQERAAFSAAQALQGKAAGVNVTQTDAKPGADPTVSIRGNRSLKATNDPLYVVDGIPLAVGLSEISQSDIESIDILKDASATAIYGSRGANGVVIITTRKGKSGKAVVDYNGYYGIETQAKKIDLFNGPEWIELIREAYRTSKIYPAVPTFDADKNLLPVSQETDPYGIAYKLQNSYDSNGVWHPEWLETTDWQKETLRTGYITNHEISARGGTDKIRILGSATYFDEKGLMRTQDYSRYSIRVNFDWDLNDYVTLGGQTQFSHYKRNDGPNVYDQAKRTSPLANIYDSKGQMITRPGNDPQIWNPLQDITQATVEYRKDRFLGSYYLEIKLPLDFRFRSNFGLDVGPYYDQRFYDSKSSDRQGGTPRAENGSDTRTMWTWENLIFWNKQIANQSFGLTLLQSLQQEKYEKARIKVNDLPYPSQEWYNVGSAPTIAGVESEYTKWQLASFMGRVNYSLMDKYLLTASIRFDGSSRLAEGHKWVAFPSAALAWRISEENFLKGVRAISSMKLRFGYGRTGNSAIDPYKTLGSPNFSRYNYGSSNVMAFYQNEMPNPNLTWEVTTQWNAGLDFGILRNRINGFVDIYLQNTDKVLMERQLPMSGGFNSVMDNIGKTRNKGIEITINTVNIDRTSFNWTTDIIFSRNKEEIVELYNGKNDDTGNKWFIGQPLSVFYDYDALGIWQLGEEAEMARYGAGTFNAGMIKVANHYNPDEAKITEDDKVVIGSTRPKFTASMANYFKYRNFDFNFFLNASYGNMIEFDRNMSFNGRYNSLKVDYWKVTGYDANGNPIASNGSNEAPRPNRGIENPPYKDALNYFKASFLRLSNITLGYTLPEQLIGKIGIQRLRIYGTVQNVFCITSFPGTDPESGKNFQAPMPRTYMLGLNLTL